MQAAGELDKIPPILAFQSVVDATVTAPALVKNLFERIPAISSSRYPDSRGQHELVLFDINRWAEIDPLMKENPSAWINPMRENGDSNFMLTLMSNQNRENKHVWAFSRLPGSSQVETCDTGLAWPEGIYSLSHVALPFSPDDPVYGGDEAGPSPGIDLGDVALRGEKGVLICCACDTTLSTLISSIGCWFLWGLK